MQTAIAMAVLAVPTLGVHSATATASGGSRELETSKCILGE
jgi:hypothetical protein